MALSNFVFKAEYNILLCNSPGINTLIKCETGHACPGKIGKSLLCVPVLHKPRGKRSDFPGLLIDLKGTLFAPFPATRDCFHLKTINSENASSAQNALKCGLIIYVPFLLLQAEQCLRKDS